jgi:hypothetical protein
VVHDEAGETLHKALLLYGRLRLVVSAAVSAVGADSVDEGAAALTRLVDRDVVVVTCAAESRQIARPTPGSRR